MALAPPFILKGTALKHLSSAPQRDITAFRRLFFFFFVAIKTSSVGRDSQQRKEMDGWRKLIDILW